MVSRSQWKITSGTRTSKKILKNNNKDDGLTLLGIRSYKALIIKTVWYCLKGRQIDQWKRTESPGTDHTIYNHSIYDKLML